MRLQEKMSEPKFSMSALINMLPELRSDVDKAFVNLRSDPILNNLNVITYPYNTLAVIKDCQRLFKNDIDVYLSNVPNNWFIDIGGAHGEISFLFERAGFRTTYVDVLKDGHTFPYVASALREQLQSGIDIVEMDIDEAFDVNRLTSSLRSRRGRNDKFGLCFFSGVLYHLKNPFRVLERIHELAHYCILTTRVFSQLPGNNIDVSEVSVAYFLRSKELNNDPTNYFIFTPRALRTILERCGFRILAFERTFNRADRLSDPVTMEREERAFVIMKADTPP